MMKKLKKDKVLFPEAKERHKEMMNNLTTGKALIISEAEKRHKKDVQRIETTLKTAPDKRKYLELEKDIVFRILKKDIDRLNDCFETMVAGQKTRYYRTGQFDWDLEQIRLIRQHYKNYLRGGNVNYAEETLTPKADNIINAIRFYQLETWLQNLNKRKEVKPQPSFSSLFITETNGTKVIELLYDHEDLSNKGEWIASGDKKKIGTAFWVLEDKRLLKPGKNLTRIRNFCLGMGITKSDNELRNILKRPEYDPHLKEDYQEFASLFEQLK